LNVKGTLACAACAAALAAAPAHAQVFGQLVPAEPVPVNGHLFGAYLNASENTVGLLSQLRLSFYPNIDFGFHGGLTRIDAVGGDLTTLRVGTDIKFLVGQAGATMPVNLSVGGALGLERGDDYDVLSIGPTVVASRNLTVGQNGAITPYAGLGLVFSSLNIGTRDETDVSFPIRLGSEFRIAPELRITAELQLLLEDDFNDDIAFVTGVNMPF
jgi:hypothetical protein